MNRDWMRVSKSAPCVICKKPDWCTYTADGRIACCMRVASARQAKNGGYVHFLKDDPAFRAPPPPRPLPLNTGLPNAVELLEAWMLSTRQEDLERHAASVNVAPSALIRLCACYAAPYGAWAFPMRDGTGKVIGIRLRAEDGRKWAVKGSAAGLFFDPDQPPADKVYITEGPTDTAAALTLGFPVVGRPSCIGQEDYVKTLLGAWRSRYAVILADNDAPQAQPDGSLRRPGYAGAMRLAAALGIRTRYLIPPVKDIRKWVAAGATRELIELYEAQQPWRT